MFMNLSSLIGKNLVAVNLKSRAKEAVISEIVEYICSQKKIKNKNEILQTILEREKKETTGIGDGVAIPHARLEHLKEVLFCVGISKAGIDFSSLDGKPVHLIVLFVTPLTESETHLKILSKVASLLGNKALVKKLLTAQTEDELYHILSFEEVGKEDSLPLSKEEIYRRKK